MSKKTSGPKQTDKIQECNWHPVHYGSSMKGHHECWVGRICCFKRLRRMKVVRTGGFCPFKTRVAGDQHLKETNPCAILLSGWLQLLRQCMTSVQALPELSQCSTIHVKPIFKSAALR